MSQDKENTKPLTEESTRFSVDNGKNNSESTKSKVHNREKRTLGKGMGALLEGFDYDVQVDAVIHKTLVENSAENELNAKYLDISSIRTNPNQPRKSFDEEALEGLARSIEERGILQPLTVEEYAPGRYSIVAGERRFRAAKIAKLDKVPAIIVNLPEIQKMEIALIENIQREDLNPVEEASAYAYLIERSKLSQAEIAEKVGKARSSIANSLRLLNLSDQLKDDLIAGAISPGHARAILSLKNKLDEDVLREKIINEGLSVRKAEELAEAFNKGQKVVKKSKGKVKDEEIREVEQKFISAVGSRCEIKGNLKKGKLTIKFRSSRDLERIFSLLSDGGELFD